MAITKCDECGKVVSEHAPVCPHCGISRQPVWNTAHTVIKVALAIVGGIGLAIIVLLFYYKNKLWG